MSEIYVIGSMSMDLVTEVARTPQKGETIIGHHFFMTPGGKGANQAVAAARLGGNVHMVGCVGDDEFGRLILQNLKDNHVDINHVETMKDCASGTASIMLSEQDNSIVVVPSANYHVTIAQVKAVLNELKDDDIVMLQNEIPIEVVEFVIDACHARSICTLYNPAPFIEVSEELLWKVTYFTPNETEVKALFGADYEDVLQRYAGQMIVTLGEQGVSYFDKEQANVPAYPTEVLDTTGAGDTFNGAFAVALSEKMTLTDAVAFGNRAAGLSVTRLGAQVGMPYRKEMLL